MDIKRYSQLQLQNPEHITAYRDTGNPEFLDIRQIVPTPIPFSYQPEAPEASSEHLATGTWDIGPFL